MCLTQTMNPAAPPEIQRAGSEAMLHALEFASHVFESAQPAFRNSIMQAVCGGTAVPDLATRKNSFECICKVAELYYPYLTPYMVSLYDLTLKAVEAEEEIAIRAVEFWNVVCEVEIAVSFGMLSYTPMNYVRGAKDKLLPLLLKIMTKQTEDYDDETFTVAMAGSTCLALVAQNVGDDCLTIVAAFIKSTFEHADWHMRDAATMALGSILEGPTDAKLGKFVEFVRRRV